jgi:hypothetical protein
MFTIISAKICAVVSSPLFLPFAQCRSRLCNLVQVLPRVAGEISTPLSSTKKITMVSSGDGPIGASRLTAEVQQSLMPFKAYIWIAWNDVLI